ncbi:hypothetical protein DXT99_23015 [Pontibacter diazotrophicus]|uniref:Uncharacterized protein n=1 Tax=Pontibacter diazotrophicus TaxID=1400979 RepID=A0A3D8L3K2_9BACT|nr:hypothetical protein [Pontibacter diazotrophicus]RDV12004.1 hypothetical protein DXT99_23015 [Pontibacter diazotrophicus]
MPQGTVIAVKPVGFASELQLMKANVTETASSTTRSTENSLPTANLLYIEVYEDKLKSRVLRKAKSVVWYEDTRGEFRIGDYVEFDINNKKTKPIDAAENVRKIKDGGILLHGSLLTTVALFASSLLIFAVIFDKRR